MSRVPIKFDIKPRPILHIIARDLETERHIINEINKRRKEDPDYLTDYYVFLSYKGECEMEVWNGELESIEIEDGYEPDKDAQKTIVESGESTLINKIKRFLRV